VWRGKSQAGDDVAVKLFKTARIVVGLTLPAFRRGVAVMNRLTARGSEAEESIQPSHGHPGVQVLDHEAEVPPLERERASLGEEVGPSGTGLLGAIERLCRGLEPTEAALALCKGEPVERVELTSVSSGGAELGHCPSEIPAAEREVRAGARDRA
jgi:hypothetical protein